MLKFYAYRYNIIEPSTIQTDLFNVRLPKETTFFSLIAKLALNQKDSFEFHGKRTMLYYDDVLADDIISFKLAKEEIYSKHIEGETTVHKVVDVQTPFVYVIIHTKFQILLIQEKVSVYKDVNTARNALQQYFNSKIEDRLLTVDIEQISDRREFWDEISKFDRIEEFDITLAAPNLFGGRFDASNVVRELHDTFNITEVQFKLKNKLGQLNLLKDNLQEFVSLAASGAGKYFVKAFKNGQEKNIRSSDFAATESYYIESPKEINKNELKKNLSLLNKKNDNPKGNVRSPKYKNSKRKKRGK